MCIVEGQGEVAAFPNLCERIKQHLEVSDWFVDDAPIRFPRSQLVDERTKSPRREAAKADLERALTHAYRRPADAVVALCDADDDCPATWGPSAAQVIESKGRGGAVMIAREYEAWLLCSHLESGKLGGRRIEEIRDARGQLRKLMPDYKQTVHQLALTRRLDIPLVWSHSDSFHKLMRTLANIFEVSCPPRPKAKG